MDKLKAENDKLRTNIKTTHKNLQTLKNLFISAANTKKDSIDINQIKGILEEIDALDTIESDHSSDSDETLDSASDDE